jgi:hypothetical protein
MAGESCRGKDIWRETHFRSDKNPQNPKSRPKQTDQNPKHSDLIVAKAAAGSTGKSCSLQAPSVIGVVLQHNNNCRYHVRRGREEGE